LVFEWDEEHKDFILDHKLCLGCQMGTGNPHLCNSCQWHLAMYALSEKRNNRLKRDHDEDDEDCECGCIEDREPPAWEDLD